jgi:hypothetical protein
MWAPARRLWEEGEEETAGLDPDARTIEENGRNISSPIFFIITSGLAKLEGGLQGRDGLVQFALFNKASDRRPG